MPELMQREGVKSARSVRLSGLTHERGADALLEPVGSEGVGRGFVQVHPQTADRFGLVPGDSVVLNLGGFVWPFRAERFAGVQPGKARMNNAEMAFMGIRKGVPVAAHRVPSPAALPHDWPVEHNRHDWLVPKEMS